MMIRTLGIAALFAFGAAACSNKTDDANIAVDETVNAAEATNAEVEVLPPNEGNRVATPGSATAALIPLQYRGRWGMNDNDCDPKHADVAKGLIVIDDKAIKFYESRAVLKTQRPAIASSFSGVFDFSGEGQQWTSAQTLKLTGDTLERVDDEGTYSYARCA